MVDQDGLPVRLLITPGQASDKAAVPELLDGLPAAQALVADRGYDSMAIIELVRRLGGEIASLAFMVELTALNGRQKLGEFTIHTLITY